MNIVPNTTPTQKCICVPSGMCHSNSLLGCPHKHYFDNNTWICTPSEAPSWSPRYNILSIIPGVTARQSIKKNEFIIPLLQSLFLCHVSY